MGRSTIHWLIFVMEYDEEYDEASDNPVFTLGFKHDSATSSAIIGCKQST